MAFALASAISAGMSYLTTPLFTRLLSSEEYGVVTVFLTWQSIFAIIAMFSLNYGVFNNGMMDYSNNRDEYSFSLLLLSNLITTCFCVVLFLIKIAFPNAFDLEWKFIILMMIVYYFQPAYNFWLARQRYEYNYKPAFIAALLISVFAPVISVICVVLSFDKVEGRIFGLEGALLVVYFCFYLYLGYKVKWKLNRNYWKEAFLFNLPLIPHYLSIYVLSSSDKLMISSMVGHSATSYYSVSYTIASVALIFWGAINGSLIPYTYEKCRDNDFESLKNKVNAIILVIAVCCVMVYLIAPEIMYVLGSSEYRDSVLVIPPIIGGVFFQVHYSLFANVLYYYRKPKLVMLASITAALVNIIANFFFIKRFGYIAAGYTTLFSYIIQASIDYYAMKYVTKQRIYDMHFIVYLSVFIILMSLGMPLLYSYTLLRYVLIALFLLVALLFKNKIKNTISLVL